MTNKQIRFCEEYIIDWNASRAAKEAGYSKRTAGEQGYQLLQNPSIQEYISKIQADLQKQAGVSALRNILELKKIAYSDISFFHKNWFTLNEWEKIPESALAAVSDIKHTKRTVKNADGDPETIDVIQVKLHDKLKAIETLNKMLGYNEPEQTDTHFTIRVEEKLVS